MSHKQFVVNNNATVAVNEISTSVKNGNGKEIYAIPPQELINEVDKTLICLNLFHSTVT